MPGWNALVCLGALALFTPGSLRSTVLELRLQTPVSSYSSRPGDPVSALVLATVSSQECAAIPPGSLISGFVKQARRVGLGLVHETARLEIEFNELSLPSGEVRPLEARLAGVNNARERVDSRGKVRGIRATESFSHRIARRVAGLALSRPAAFTPLFVVQQVVFRFPEPEIIYEAGTELHLRVDPSLTAGLGCDALPPVTPLEEEAAGELREVLLRKPYWSHCGASGKPSDITNLLLIGSAEELDRAFQAAGWTAAQALSVRSKVEVARAVAERRAYLEGPMRDLLLAGTPPTAVKQKALNTFTKRHHLRLWRQEELWRGRELWLVAASHDIGASFALRPFGFTHRIDANVDRERDKVVRDLVMTGCVDSAGLIDRPPEMRSEGGDRKELRTDHGVAVVSLNPCTPAGAPEVVPDSEGLRPGKVARKLRRVTLTTRNYFLRDNLAWRAYEGVALGVRAVRHCKERRSR